MGIQVLDQEMPIERQAKRLAEIADPKYARNLIVYNPGQNDIELLIDIASQEIPALAGPAKVIEMFRHNPECFWAISRVRHDNMAAEWPEGFFAILPLNEKGAEALVSGRFRSGDPDIRYVASQWERPAAIYFWCIYAPGALSAGLSWWANLYQSPKFNGVPVFAKAGTSTGAHFFKRLGFQEGAVWNGVRNDAYISLCPAPHRAAPRAGSVMRVMPAYENYARRYGLAAEPEELSCSLVHTIDELLQAMAIRSVVYIGDQKCPFGEEWDGNDLSADHIIARKGDEPIGTIRLRCFAGVAKVERLAVLPAFRNTRAAFKLERAVSELARAKGYAKLIGHAHANVLNFWLSRGWRPIEGRENFAFSDHECVQIEKNVEPHSDAIAYETDPLTLIRPVGRWHVPGPLDASAQRPPVNAEAGADAKHAA